MTLDLETLRQALETMADADRAVFERARFDDRNLVDIAAELAIEVEEAERRLGRAMFHLVRTLGGKRE